MKGLAERLLDWNNKKFDEIDVSKDKHPYLKAFGTGAIQGYIDSAVVLFPMVLAAGYYWKYKSTKK